MSTDYKYGVTGFVRLSGTLAHKHMLFTELYWVREYANLLRLRSFNHSNIVRYESGSFVTRIPPKGPEKNKLYFELTFPRYPKTLKQTTVYSDETFVQLTLDLFSAVELAHSQGIWHRDIKGDNIMVTDSNRAMLIDFTHSVRIRTNRFTLDDSVETFTHRAPEVYAYVDSDNTNTYDEKIDIWSLGIMMFEMVTDKGFNTLMTVDNSEEEIKTLLNDVGYLQRIEHAYFQNKRTLFWADQYWEWIKKCLEYDPQKRVSAKEIVESVLKFVVENDIKVCMPTWKDSLLLRNKMPECKSVDDTNMDVYNLMYKKIKDYFKHCSASIGDDVLSEVIVCVVNRNSVTKNNYIVTSLALTIIILTLVYDIIDDIPNSVEYLCKATKCPKVKHKDVHQKIIQIIQKHDKDLFLYDKFNFYT